MAKDTKKSTVLIVDDDDMMLQMAEFILNKDTDLRILKANSGMQCIGTLQQEIVDLVLLDIQMPGMDGLKTMELIRKREDWRNIPVIFLTATSDKGTVIKASQLGVAGYIKKPFLPQDLVQRVETALLYKALDDPDISTLLDQLDTK